MTEAEEQVFYQQERAVAVRDARIKRLEKMVLYYGMFPDMAAADSHYDAKLDEWEHDNMKELNR